MMKKIYLSILSTIFFVCLNVDALQAAFILKAGGDPTNPADWGTNAAGTTGGPANFAVTNTYSFTNNNSSITLSTAWNITSGSSVNFGNGVNNFTFTLASGGSIGNAGIPNLILKNHSTIILQAISNFGFFTSKTNFNPGSTIVYDTGSEDPVPLFQDNFENLIIASSHSMQAFPNVNLDLTVNAPLNLTNSGINVVGNVILNSDLTFGGGVLLVGGSFSGNGTLVGDNTAQLDLSGTGNIGTLNFSGGAEVLKTFNVNLGDAASIVTLGNDLSIDGGAIALGSGILDLISFQLNVMGTANTEIDFNGGSIAGDPSSSLILEGAINGTMLMDAVDNSLFYVLLSSPNNTLTLGNELHIEGIFNPRAGVLDAGTGFLVLKSTASSKGSIGMVQPAADIIGEIKVETFIPQSVTGWGQLGVSGVKGQLVSDWEDDIAMTCSLCPFDELSTGGYFVSINRYNEPTDTYDTATKYTDPLPPGIGFWVYLGDGQVTSNPLMLVNTGSAVIGSTSIPITNAGTTGNAGWNLVANPYPSTIDWNKVWAITNNSNNINPEVFTWSASGGDESYVFGVGTGSGSQWTNGLIAMGQGFYVQSLVSSASIEFTEGVKDTAFPPNNASILARSASANFGKIFKLKLKGAHLDLDDQAFRIHPNATPLFDRGLDAEKLFKSPGYAGYPGSYSKYTTISSKDPQGKNYSIHSIPPLTQSLSIPILVQAMYTGQYTITATEFEDIENCLLLKDKLTGTIHDLKSGPVIVTIADTTSTPRFELMMCGDASPVGISELKASSNIFINQDQNGAFVTTQFDTPTQATITAYNIVGQQLMAPITVNGTSNTTHLNLDVHSQVVLIKVTTNNESVVKKIITH
jgi:hypothetical protein